MRTRATLLLFYFFSLDCAQLFAQPPNTYASSENVYYWKNRPPYPGYWQQDVHYVIKARLDDGTDVMNGELTLYYQNNSPDTLQFVFFHLYQEAYVKDSYLEKKYKADGRSTKVFENSRYAGTHVQYIINDGDTLRTEQDNTVLKVWLQNPLLPGQHTQLDLKFDTHWSRSVQRRMKLFSSWGNKHYDGVHWYPRMAVYDRKFGWDTQQHLGSEFYGDFGVFDVELDFPHHYVLDATGSLLNEADVLPVELKTKLAISNFRNKPWNEAPSVITTPDTTQRKVWKFHAENVHDLAFTADPTYRIGEAEWNGVKCVALVQEPHASGWQNAAEFSSKVIQCFSRDFGMYAYPKIIVADARDGMEYPMLTLNGGRDPDYRSLFTHEIGHNWFFGMLGSNETYRAFMDEGFTQFITSWGLEHIDGQLMIEDIPKNFYERAYTDPEFVRESQVYYSYQKDAVREQVPPINVHSDEFGHVEGFGRGYGHVYDKTGVMLYNLQYVLGDELFLAAMQHYVDQWKICHPYPEDMRQSFIDFTHVDLNWFFDQWIETDKLLDYSVKSIKRKNKDEGQLIRLRRKGDMQMPIDLVVTANNGRIHEYHIPNTWFIKKTDANVLPRWIGYDDLARDYTAKVNVRTGIADVRIDTTGRLADKNMLNNSLHLPVEVMFDHHIRRRPDRHAYEVFVRPDIWWNGYDGIKAGIHLNSSYFKHKHQIDFTGWLNTGVGQYLSPTNPVLTDSFPGSKDVGFDPFSFNFTYQNGTDKIAKGSEVYLMARHLDGLRRYGAGWRWKLPNAKTRIDAKLLYFIRKDTADLTYLLYQDQWELNRLNGVLDFQVEQRYKGPIGRGKFDLDLRSSTIGSASRYAQLRLTNTNTLQIAGMMLRTRLMGQYGSGNTPRESALFLASANPEEMMENKYMRSVGFVPYEWLGYGTDVQHLQYGGGLGLRGYAGYLAPETTDDGGIVYTYMGNTGAAANGELDLSGLINFRPGKLARYLHLDIYLFGDIGSMSYTTVRNSKERLNFALPRADAGAGIALTIKKFGPLVDIKPLTIRFDMPLFLSAVPAGQPDNFAFRYVVAIGRNF